MSLARQQTLTVAHPSDGASARRSTRDLAAEMGFTPLESEEIALVVSELAANLVKYAGGGSLILTELHDDGRTGIEIVSLDNGPGIDNVEQALGDGYSTGSGLGYGLGTANRLMDHLEITTSAGGGTRIVGRRWQRAQAESHVPCPLAFGVATRPHVGMTVNGDAFVIHRWGDSALVGVIDGLGHGAFAHRAAQTARHYVEGHYDQPLAAIFRGVDRACRSTRGVVMALARFDWSKATMMFASIGNIEARVFGSPEPMNFLVRRGVLGTGAPAPLVTEQRWLPHYQLVLHSDGLTTHWRREDVLGTADEPAAVMAQRLLRALAKNDDATVVVVRDQVP